MDNLQLGELMTLMKEFDKLSKNILPDDYIESEASEADQDFTEEMHEVSLLISELKLALSMKNLDEAETVLVKLVIVVSGIESLFANITDDVRDIIRGQYRFGS